MNRFERMAIAAVVVAALVGAAPADAGKLSTGTLRGSVISIEPSCHFCNTSLAGCYVVLDAGADPVNVVLPAGTSCSLLEEGDCIEATGDVANTLVSSGFAITSYQLETILWAARDSSACD